jgi:16S rRNA (cytosine1402-N4)-methyltransferase
VCNHKASINIITKKPIIPTEAEIEQNARSTSAKLRIAEKII